ncbi:HEPN domain-containing protein [Bacillus cereus]|uniref:hypothetical protein n=1 Tax=Bacillus thuringiensis TaxID=1428 RepID=UPI002E9AFDF1|nr:HEPN domain-containing protein [Bacillus cereus]
MQVNIVGSFKHLSVEETNLFLGMEYGYIICNDQLLLKNKFFEKPFIEYIGKLGIEALEKSPYIYNYFDLNQSKQYSLEEINKFIRLSWGPVEWFLFSLWFVKDNSVKVDYLYLYEPENYFIIRDKSNLWPSNSRGQYKITSFTSEELKKALQWQALLYNYALVAKKEALENCDVNDLQIQNYSAQIPYADMNRISRALRFIKSGRGESFLPVKISAYVGALESLFSTTKSEVTHQVAERAVKILGGDIDTRMKNYTLIKNVYDIRSMYVHGSDIKGKVLRRLPDLAESFDELMRSILKTVIKDYSFLSEMKQNELDIWFKKLILQ